MTALLALSACGTSPNRLYENDQFKPLSWKSVVVFGVASEKYDTRLGIQTYLLDEGKFDTCPADAKMDPRAWAVDWPHVHYVAYSVPPGHYAFQGSYAPDLERSVFVVPPRKTIYLGDFISPSGKDTYLERNLERARATLARYPLLDGRQLENAEIIKVDKNVGTVAWGNCPPSALTTPFVWLASGLDSLADGVGRAYSGIEKLFRGPSQQSN